MRCLLIIFFLILLASCGFHLQGKMKLSPFLHKVYIRSADPYSYLVRNLTKFLKMSQVEVVDFEQDANAVIAIVSDQTNEQLLGVNDTQQTRQILLTATVIYSINDKVGHILFGPDTLTEQRIITMQSNQVLGSSNEMTFTFLAMRRALVYAMINRISSINTTHILNQSMITASHLKPISS